MEEKTNENIVKEAKVTEKRVGTMTFGIMLILIGISVIVMTFTNIQFVKYLLMAWPVILILLGVEIIYLNGKKNTKIKFDFLSIFMMLVILFFTAIFSVGNYVANKVLYDNDIKSIIVHETMGSNSYSNYIDGKVTIQNKTNKNVVVKFIQNDNYKDSCYVYTNFDFNSNKITSMYDAYRFFRSREIYAGDNSVIIETLPEYIDGVIITITTSTKDNIIYNGVII